MGVGGEDFSPSIRLASPRGGDRRSGRIEAHGTFLMAVVEDAPDITLAELRERLGEERGEELAISTIHEFFLRHGMSYNETRRTPASSGETM